MAVTINSKNGQQGQEEAYMWTWEGVVWGGNGGDGPKCNTALTGYVWKAKRQLNASGQEIIKPSFIHRHLSLDQSRSTKRGEMLLFLAGKREQSGARLCESWRGDECVKGRLKEAEEDGDETSSCASSCSLSPNTRGESGWQRWGPIVHSRGPAPPWRYEPYMAVQTLR